MTRIRMPFTFRRYDLDDFEDYQRLRKEVGDNPDRQIERAFLLALCRPPTQTERATMTRFLEREPDRQLALEQLCRVILNLNEFVYAD